MILCFDGGNSRLKWGLADASGWLEQGALEWQELVSLPARLAAWGRPERALLASVAGPEAEAALQALLPGLDLEPVRSTGAAAGVRNSYLQPGSLGVDRWCALIGARSLESRPCLVVSAGTATTIDSLDGEGVFLGGLILPGLDMMQAALARGTARLPLAAGRHQAYPRETGDAIRSGCLEAQAGAVERAYQRLPGAACCFLAGGAGPALAPLLSLPLRSEPYLVLEGVRQLALTAP